MQEHAIRTGLRHTNTAKYEQSTGSQWIDRSLARTQSARASTAARPRAASGAGQAGQAGQASKKTTQPRPRRPRRRVLKILYRGLFGSTDTAHATCTAMTTPA